MELPRLYNDGIKDFLYSGTMRPTNINTTGKDTSGACGGKKCDGEMPGPTLYLGQKDGSFIDNSKLIIDKRDPSGQSLSCLLYTSPSPRD